MEEGWEAAGSERSQSEVAGWQGVGWATVGWDERAGSEEWGWEGLQVEGAGQGREVLEGAEGAAAGSRTAAETAATRVAQVTEGPATAVLARVA
jgi:hypothetical protein